MSFRPRTPFVWFAVGGGAFAWATQFVAGLAFSFAQCNQPGGRWQLPLHDWTVGLAAGGAVVALASMGASVWLFVRTSRLDDVLGQELRGDGSAPPIGRINFLAIVGLVVNLLALAIIVMDGVAGPLLPICQQA